MRITNVHYQKLANLGGYENERVGAWADVPEDGDPAAILDELKGWVEDKLDSEREAREEATDLQQRINILRFEFKEHESRVKAARERWETVKTFCRANGVDLPEIVQDEIPF